MSIFLIVKVVHILAVITAVGTNVTSVLWLRRAGLERERLVWTLESTRWFDRRIANPAYIVVLLSGLVMVVGGEYRLDQSWLAVSIALYVFTAAFGIIVFAPAVRVQRAEAAADPTSPAYARIARRTWRYSWLTTGIVMTIVFLMVTKPS